MTVVLYKTSDENNRVVKSLTDDISMQGTLVEATNVISPSLLIEGNAEITSYNYCYVSEFHRYYFIKEITAIRNRLWRIDLRCDVLMTYNEGIKSLNAIILRQEGIVNNLLDDGIIPIQANQTNAMITFPKSFTKNLNYILAVSGG